MAMMMVLTMKVVVKEVVVAVMIMLTMKVVVKWVVVVIMKVVVTVMKLER